MHNSESDTAHQNLLAALELYFDGLYFGDLDRLSLVFHPQAHYICATGPKLELLTMEHYFPRVAQRPSPSSRYEQRQDRVVSIDYAGPGTALAKVNCAIGDRYFTDFLNFIFIDNRWQIIAKVFHYEQLNTETTQEN